MAHRSMSDLHRGRSALRAAFGLAALTAAVAAQDSVVPTFAPDVLVPTAESMGEMILADLTGDGRDDVIALSADRRRLHVQVSSEDGLQPPGAVVELPWAARLRAVGAVGDVDGDGAQDIVVISSDAHLAVVYGDGIGGLLGLTITEIPDGDDLLDAALGDLDGDGAVEVVVLAKNLLVGTSDPNPRRHGIRVLSDAGPDKPLAIGVFHEVAKFNIFSAVYDGIGIMDQGGDGQLDVLLWRQTLFSDSMYFNWSGGVRVLPGDGLGELGPAVTLLSDSEGLLATLPLNDPSEALFADFDGDGHTDLILSFSNIFIATQGLFLRGPGFNVAVPELTLSARPMAAADLAGDGQVELLGWTGSTFVGPTCATVAEILLDATTPDSPGHSLCVGGPLSASPEPLVAAFGDVDGDGRPDIVHHDPGAPGWIVALNTSPPLPAWTSLGRGLAGAAGTPVLTGSGGTLAGELVGVTLAQASPGAMGWLVLGLSALDLPFHGGVLVPSPDLPPLVLTASVSGGAAWEARWPTGLPIGVSLWMQAWIVDGQAVDGWAASNALLATAGHE